MLQVMTKWKKEHYTRLFCQISSIILLFIVGCTNTQRYCEDIAENQEYKEFPFLEFDYFEIKNQSSVIYLMDASCSMCIGKYIDFIKNVYKQNIKTDTLYTIVCGANDILTVDYYMEQESIKHPKNEKIIIDKSNITSKIKERIKGQNIILLDGKNAYYATSIFNYKYDKDLGLIRQTQK